MMSALLSVPRLAEGAGRATAAALASAVLAPSASVRQRAGASLRDGIARGLISPARARRALARGDAAVARLLAPLQWRGQPPVVTSDAFAGEMAGGDRVPVALHDDLRHLIAALTEGGDLSQDDHARMRSCPSVRVVAHVLSSAWTRRVAQITAPLTALAGECAGDGLEFLVIPEVLNDLPGMAPDAANNRLRGVLLEPLDAPVLVCVPASMRTDADLVAVDEAWMGVAEAMPIRWLLCSLHDGFDVLCGMYGELFRDAALAATWSGDQPTVPEDCVTMLREEMGWDLDDPDHRAHVTGLLQFMRRMDRLARLAQSRAARSARGRRAACHPAVERLRRLADIARTGPRASKEQEWMPVETYINGLLVTRDRAALSMMNGCVDDVINSGCDNKVMGWPTKASGLGDVLDAAIWSAAVANTAARCLAEPARRRRS